MPVNADQIKDFASELTTDLASASGDERARVLETAAALLPSDLRQHVFNGGHKQGKQDGKGDSDAASRELKKAKEDLTKAQKDLDDLRKQQPDVEAVRRDYEDKLVAKEQEKQTAVRELTDKMNADRLRTAQTQIEAAMVAGGATPTAAKLHAILAVQEGRVKVDEQSGEVRVYDKDGATPLAAVAGKAPEVLLAEGIVKALPATDRAGKGSAGAGESGGADSEAGKASFFDGIRKEAKETTPAGAGADEELDRLAGLRR